MKKTVIITLFILTNSLLAQQKKTFHPELFNQEVMTKVATLEKVHPVSFFEEAGKYYKDGNLNESALLFYVGQLRYRYYILAHPDTKPDGDKAIFASLQNVLGKEINYKLGENVDNYIKILEAIIDYSNENDYQFYSKKESPENYKKVIEGLIKLKNYVITNKEQFIARRKENTKK
ncbi:hypothetical protein [Flavobacterium daejeonense]|uniref:hypothetical protein n=1 Tax=Flavobacterium daejeonense TaxID=350893 RepID=UPI00047AEE5D|nr:hypothetical protein [Flavobacterium daejeonense]